MRSAGRPGRARHERPERVGPGRAAERGVRPGPAGRAGPGSQAEPESPAGAWHRGNRPFPATLRSRVGPRCPARPGRRTRARISTGLTIRAEPGCPTAVCAGPQFPEPEIPEPEFPGSGGLQAGRPSRGREPGSGASRGPGSRRHRADGRDRARRSPGHRRGPGRSLRRRRGRPARTGPPGRSPPGTRKDPRRRGWPARTSPGCRDPVTRTGSPDRSSATAGTGRRPRGCCPGRSPRRGKDRPQPGPAARAERHRRARRPAASGYRLPSRSRRPMGCPGNPPTPEGRTSQENQVKGKRPLRAPGRTRLNQTKGTGPPRAPGRTRLNPTQRRPARPDRMALSRVRPCRTKPRQTKPCRTKRSQTKRSQMTPGQMTPGLSGRRLPSLCHPRSRPESTPRHRGPRRRGRPRCPRCLASPQTLAPGRPMRPRGPACPRRRISRPVPARRTNLAHRLSPASHRSLRHPAGRPVPARPCHSRNSPESTRYPAPPGQACRGCQRTMPPRSGWSRSNLRRRRRPGTHRARRTHRWCRSGRPGRSGSSRMGSARRRREDRRGSAGPRTLAGHRPSGWVPRGRRGPRGRPQPAATRDARHRTASYRYRASPRCLDRRWPRSSPNLPTERSRAVRKRLRGSMAQGCDRPSMII
jgi:hypothetical protein